MKSENSLTLHRQQHNWNVPRPRKVVRSSVKQSMWHQWLNFNAACARFLLNVNNADYVDYVLGKARAHIVVLTKMVEDGNSGEELLNNYVIFDFFAHKKYSCSFAKLKLSHWCHMDCFIDVITTFLGCVNISVLLSMKGQRALRFHQKCINLCSENEWGWVINDKIFIFGLTNPLSRVMQIFHKLMHEENS